MTEAGVNRHTVEIAEMKLSFTVEGCGAPLFVVGSSIYYPRTFSRRLKESRTLVCADLPHFVQHQASFRPDAISFELYANCIERVRAATGFEQVAIVGHSHHGNVAVEYAKRYPHRVSHVAMIGSPPADIAHTIAGANAYWESEASDERKALLQDRRRSIDQDRMAALDPREAYIAQYVADAPLYWHDPSYDASWLWRDMEFGMEAVHAFRDLYRTYELTWDAESLKAPVMIVMGRDDYAVPYRLWDEFLPRLENITFHLLDRSGHTPQLEQPEAFDQILLSWLQGESEIPQSTDASQK